MFKQEFDRLTRQQQIQSVLTALIESKADVLQGNSKRYHNLAKLVAPDLNPDCEDLATHALAALNQMRDNPPTGAVGSQPPTLQTYATPAHTYTMSKLLGTGDIAHAYEATDETGRVVVVKLSLDQPDMLDNEVIALKRLNSDSLYLQDGAHYIPELVERSSEANVIAYGEKFLKPSEMYTLTEIGAYYDHKIPPKAVGWITSRVLGALMFAHDLGVIHGAVTPDNIIVEPIAHKVALIDWIHSSSNDQPINSLSSKWESLYPPETRQKPPAVPGFDFYLAAASITSVAQNLPSEMIKFFDGMKWPSWYGRPSSAANLLTLWYNILRAQLRWPQGEFVPLDFDPTKAAAQSTIDWSWFDEPMKRS